MHSETAKLAHHFAVAKAATNFAVPVILAVMPLIAEYLNAKN